MPIPPNEVKTRIDELFAQIDQKFRASRSGIAGHLHGIKGFFSNRYQRLHNQSEQTSLATMGHVANAATFGAISKAHIPGISHLAELPKYGVDKLIQHGQKKLLSPAFASLEPDPDDVKMQSEYVALELAQKIIDGIRKVEDALKEVRKSQNQVKDCSTFIEYLDHCQYLYYRTQRLLNFNNMLQTWAANVDAEAKRLYGECEAEQNDNHRIATEIVGDYRSHLDKCKGNPCCLFKPEWVKYLYQDRGAAVGGWPHRPNAQP